MKKVILFILFSAVTLQAQGGVWLLFSSSSEPSYKVYTALLSQPGTDPPTATILENTLGFTLNLGGSTGNYFQTTGIEMLTWGKTICFISGGSASSGFNVDYKAYLDNSEGVVFVMQCISTEYADLFNGAVIEIRVYP